jgi:hypothetical protein
MADGETTSLRDDLLIGVNAIADSRGESPRRAHDGSGAHSHLRIIRSRKRRLGPRTPGNRAARPAEILVMEGLDVSITGFSPVEIDQLTVDFEEDTSDPDDPIDPEWTTAAPVSDRFVDVATKRWQAFSARIRASIVRHDRKGYPREPNQL